MGGGACVIIIGDTGNALNEATKTIQEVLSKSELAQALAKKQLTSIETGFGDSIHDRAQAALKAAQDAQRAALALLNEIES